jgi:hypothetical protein
MAAAAAEVPVLYRAFLREGRRYTNYNVKEYVTLSSSLSCVCNPQFSLRTVILFCCIMFNMAREII